MATEHLPGWTIDTLYLHLVQMMDERDRRYQEIFESLRQDVVRIREDTKVALLSADKLLNKVEDATNRKIDGVKEAQSVLNTRIGEFLPRGEYDRSLGGLAKRVDDMHKALLEKFEHVTQTFNSQIETVEARVGGVEAVVR